MRIHHLSIHNYKSLRSISLDPRDLNVIVGSNAAGKTNLADAVDFVSEVYRHGLEVAVARKGGYENIAHRRMRRSKSAIAVEVVVELTGHELREQSFYSPSQHHPEVRITHRFAFLARGYSIRAEFVVSAEELIVDFLEDGRWKQVAKIERKEDSVPTLKLVREASVEPESPAERRAVRERFLDLPDLRHFVRRKQSVPPTELVTIFAGRYTFVVGAFINTVARMRVFQLSPTKTREYGVPTPRPELDGSGSNLPAVVDLLQKNNPHQWDQILVAMRAILPNLTSIVVDYTSGRTLGLFFVEEGFGRPWSVGEVSDGTVQTLALLVAIFDPRYSALVIEEPENSIHPWIIRQILDACRTAAESKQIIITTHSPLVMNAVRPEELWVMWRSSGESHLAPVTQLDPDFMSLWQGGEVPTFEYIDGGALRQALPPEPDVTDPSED